MNKITINYGSDNAMTVGPHVIIESEEELAHVTDSAMHLVGFMDQETEVKVEVEEDVEVGVAPRECDRYGDLAIELRSNIDWGHVGDYAASGISGDRAVLLMNRVHAALMDVAAGNLDLEDQA